MAEKSLAKIVETLKKKENHEIRIVIESLLVELGKRAMRGYENEPMECTPRATKECLIDAMDALDDAFRKGVL